MYLLCKYGGALRAPVHVHDEIHTAAAEAAALAAAPATVKSGIAYACLA